MNEHEKSSHMPDRHRRGPHAEPTRLEQVEDALHRLSKRVGKLNKEQKDMKTDFEGEIDALKRIRSALAREVEELQMVKEQLRKELVKIRKDFKELTGDDDEEGTEYDPPLTTGDDDEEETGYDPPLMDDDQEETEYDPPRMTRYGDQKKTKPSP